MAFTSYGNRVYASIKDLPQYTSINNGDKIIVWNESREGAATIDYSDFIIDLEHTSFGTTINELLTFTTTVESFISTVAVDVENLDNKIASVEKVNETLKGKVETLEYLLAIVYGVTPSDSVKKTFLGDESSYYNSLVEKIRVPIAETPSVNDLITQAKFAYNAAPVNAAAATTATSISTTEIVETYKSMAPTVVTQNIDANGKVEVQKSSVSYGGSGHLAMYTLSYKSANGDKQPTSTTAGQGTLTITTTLDQTVSVTQKLTWVNAQKCLVQGYEDVGNFNISGGTIWKEITAN